MPTVDVFNVKREKVGSLALSDEVFGAEVKEQLFYEVVKAQLASQRQGTAAAKERAAVSGSSKKLYKQKGTGRARQGSLRAPHHVGGGQAHPPRPRDWSYRPPRKVRVGALKSALSLLLKEGRLIVVDKLGFEAAKTKQAAGVLKTLSDRKKTLVVDGSTNENLKLSLRNLETALFLPPEGVNVYDILRHDTLVVSQDAVKALEARCLKLEERAMQPESIIRRPILLTEKANRLRAANQIAFEVHRGANKIQIRDAVQKLFKVTVTDVHTMVYRGKDRRMGRGVAKLQNWKKAVVTLKAGDTIEFFDESGESKESLESCRSRPSSRRLPRAVSIRSSTPATSPRTPPSAACWTSRPARVVVTTTVASPRASVAVATSSAIASSTSVATRPACRPTSRRSSTTRTARAASRCSTTSTARSATSWRPTASRWATRSSPAATRTSSRGTRFPCASSRSAR